MQKTVKIEITKKCRVHDKHRKPGDTFEVSEGDAKVLIGMEKAVKAESRTKKKEESDEEVPEVNKKGEKKKDK